MADGVYEVGPSVEGSQFPAQRMAVGAGYTGYWPGQYMGSWVMYIEEGEFVKGGPAASGTVTVTRDGMTTPSQWTSRMISAIRLPVRLR